MAGSGQFLSIPIGKGGHPSSPSPSRSGSRFNILSHSQPTSFSFEQLPLKTNCRHSRGGSPLPRGMTAREVQQYHFVQSCQQLDMINLEFLILPLAKGSKPTFQFCNFAFPPPYDKWQIIQKTWFFLRKKNYCRAPGCDPCQPLAFGYVCKIPPLLAKV